MQQMKTKKVSINRAPVLTLWATVVAERLGYDHDCALTLGKAVAGLNAQAKGQRLGIFEKPKERPLQLKRKEEKPKEKELVMLLGRAIPTVRTKDGIRAKVKDEIVPPESVAKYLTQKFGEDFDDVQEAMQTLAKAYKPDDLTKVAYKMYEKFRPNVPAGEKGWGAKGELDLGLIRSLAKKPL
jgi:hypothetical protein